MKFYLLTLAKCGVSAGLLGYLFYTAYQNDSFTVLRDQPKHWGLLVLAWGMAVLAVSLTFIRWRLLVCTLGISFRMRDAFRLGFVGYLLNFFTLGLVGGDALKAVFLARQHPQRAAEAAASVVLDRLFGLFALLLVCAVGLAWNQYSGAAELADAETRGAVQVFGNAVYIATLVMTGGGLACLSPLVASEAMQQRAAATPLVGPALARLVGAASIYRRAPSILVVSLLLSIGTHLLFALSVYLVARGLPGEAPTLLAHGVIVPAAMLANALPLPGGLGAFEYALNLLYSGFGGPGMQPQHGFVVALGFRVITLLIAMIGVGYYLTGKRKVEALMKEARTAK